MLAHLEFEYLEKCFAEFVAESVVESAVGFAVESAVGFVEEFVEEFVVGFARSDQQSCCLVEPSGYYCEHQRYSK